MIKQTNAEYTLRRRNKGEYKGDEDNLKSSTDTPKKEVIITLSFIDCTNRIEEWKSTCNGKDTIYVYIKKIKDN